MKKSLLAISLFVSALVLEAQVQIPAPSPAGSVSTTVGLTDIKIDYSRPRAKGRRIFGEELTSTTAQPQPVASAKKKKGAVVEPPVPVQAPLVPYGKLWRTGANQGTKITFSDDVTVEGTKVPKGEYLIFTWPGASEWTVALYKDVKLGGNTNKYDATQEAANFKVKSEKLTEKVETFTINVGDIADDSKSAKVQLAWENTSVKFTVGVDYDAKVMKSIDTYTKVSPNNYFQAAVYYLESGK